MAENDENGENAEGTTPTYKILLVGNNGVGKSVFLARAFGEDFQPDFVATVGVDFRRDTVERYGKTMDLHFWDTAGQERYHSLTTGYFRGGAAFILMFDLTDEESFNSVNNWVLCVDQTSISAWLIANAEVESIQDKSRVEKPFIVLIGNKRDLEENRVITPEQCKELAESLGYKYFETSVKDCINVKETIDYIIEKLAGPPPEPTPSPPRPESPSPSPERKYKCYC